MNLIRVKAKYNLAREINSFLIVINSLILLISCQNASLQDSKQVFRYNSPGGISSLDPAYARTQENIRAVNQLFNGLIALDDSLNVIPAIANRWKVDSSGKLYTFSIRSDVFFHKHSLFNKDSQRRVIASDFVYSFRRLMKPETASDGAWIFNGIIKDSLAFHAIDDTTLQIKLSKPFTPFLGLLSMAYCYVVPREVVEHYGKSFGKNPVGTGPFRFANWEEGVKLNLIKNEMYFERGLPYLDAVSIRFIQSKQTELLELIQGNLDAFSGLESSFKDELLKADGSLQSKYTPKFELMLSPFLNTEFLAFQMESGGIVSDKSFRRALNYAVNREAMITYLRNNAGIPAEGGFTPVGLNGHFDESPYHYNPAKALEELKKSAYRRDKDRLTLYTTKDYLDLCVLVQKDLEKIGVALEINVVPSALLRQKKSSGELTFFRGSWIADYADAENYMACFYSENKAPAGPNYCRFSNYEFDSLYRSLIHTLEPKEKRQLIYQMEKILLDEAPFIILFYDKSLWVHNKNVSGLRVNALNHPDLRRVMIRKG